MIFLLKQIEKIAEKNIISKDTYNKLIEYFENYTYTDNSFSEEDKKLIKIENKKGNFDIFSGNDLLNAKKNGIINNTEFTDILTALKQNHEGLASIVKKEYIENDDKLCFETTPLSKVMILSFLSCGIYNIILSINYWKILKNNFGYNVSPVWRGLFDIFTNFKLFPILAKYFKNFNIKFVPIWFAIIYIICRSHLTLTVNDNIFDLCGIHIHIADIIDIDSILGFFALSQNFKIIADMNSDYSLSIKTIIFAIICLILALNLGGALIYATIQNNINKINKEHYPKAIKNDWNVKNIIWSIILALLLVVNMVGFTKTINNNKTHESSQVNLKKGNVKFNYSWQTMSLDADLSIQITPPEI